MGEWIVGEEFESLIGALYLARGLEVTRTFLLELLREEIEKAAVGASIRDHKSELQETAQRRYNQVPRYRIVSIDGPDHDRTFRSEVDLFEQVAGVGEGKSKKSAEQSAARKALRRLEAGWMSDREVPAATPPDHMAAPPPASTRKTTGSKASQRTDTPASPKGSARPSD